MITENDQKRDHKSMIPKSGYRFSEKIMLRQNDIRWLIIIR
jgi:hypothetical protein